MKKITIWIVLIAVGLIVLLQADEAESNVIPSSAKRFVENVENAAENFVEGVAEKIGFATGSAKEKADTAKDTVKEKAENARDTIRENAHYAKNKVDDYSEHVRRNTNTAAENLRDKSRHVKDKFTNAREKAGTYAESAKENIKENVENVAGDVKEKVGYAKERVGEYAEDLKESATNFAGNIKEKIGDAKERVVNAAEGVAEKVLPQEVIDMVDPISDTIQGGVNKVRRNLNNLKSYKDAIVRKLFPKSNEELVSNLQDKAINENELIIEWAKREGYDEIVPILIEKNYDLEKLGSINTSNIKDELKITDQSFSLRIIDSIDKLFEIVDYENARSPFETTGDFATPVNEMIL